MAGWNLLNKNNSRTRIGVETTLGTASTNMKDLVILDPAMPLAKNARKMLANKDQRRRRRDFVQPVKGLQIDSPIDMMVEAKRILTILDDSATPVAYSHADALSHQILMRAMFGAELTPAAGSTVAGSSSTTALVNVASGHGSRFVVGQVIGVTTSNGLEIRRVSGISTDALSVTPALSTAPAAGAVVRNAYNYMPTESDAVTHTIDHAYVESGTPENQRRARGCALDVSLDLKVGEIPTFKVTGTSTVHDGPGDLSLSTAATDDDEGAPFVWDPALWLSAASSAPTNAEISTLKLSLPHSWQRVMGPGVQGTSRMVEIASRDKPIVVELSGHMGTAEYAAWVAGTVRHLVTYALDGSGADARAIGLYFPRLVPMEEPTEVAEGELVFFSGKYLALQDNLAATDIGRANVIGFRL
jgi:hypothetical protein